MNCTKDGCKGHLRVSNTYVVRTAKFQRAYCDACGRVHVIQSIAEPAGGRGQGARARAARAQRTK